MRVSTYTTFWGVTKAKLDYRGALDNWATFSDEISVAVPLSDTDDSAALIEAYAKERGYPVVITRVDSDFVNDPFAYGKTENAALQACTGDLMCQANGDERWGVQRERLKQLHETLQASWSLNAFWVPTIDLYGSADRYLEPVKTKWYAHGPGLFRGPHRSGIKANGRPDYHKTSSDELLDAAGNLAATAALLPDLSIERVREYAAAGWPVVYHIGFLSFADRLDRSLWWKAFWERATLGDTNSHATTIEELAAKETKEHGLPLWRTTNSPQSPA